MIIRRLFRKSLGLALAFTLSASAMAVVRTVPGDYSTIQAAIDASSSGDEVVVSPGTYVESIGFAGKGIIVRSTNPYDPSVVAATIIAAPDGNKTVFLTGGDNNTTSVLRGLTITRNAGIDTGGIVGGGTSVIIEYNRIIDNQNAFFAGAGIVNSNATIQNNLIEDNATAEVGGGLLNCHGLIQNNVIRINQSNKEGAAMYNCDGIIRNNTIYGNFSQFGYTGSVYDCNGTFYNNIVYNNGTGAKLNQYLSSSTPSYSCIENNAGGGTGNFTADPDFVDAANGNFILNPTSPCIDAGELASGLTLDYRGFPRPFDYPAVTGGDGSNFDVGAIELTTAPSSVEAWVHY